MKFGKVLARAVLATNQICPSFIPETGWMDYKKLKKVIKQILSAALQPKKLLTNKGPAPAASEIALRKAAPEKQTPQRGDLVQNEYEVVFFRSLKSEVRRVTTHFLELKCSLFAEVGLLMSAVEAQATGEHSSMEWGSLEKRIVDANLRLVLLENFSVLNYDGFKKILKKHDKVTGWKTQGRFMNSIVDSEPFTSILEVSDAVQKLTMLLTKHQPEAAANVASSATSAAVSATMCQLSGGGTAADTRDRLIDFARVAMTHETLPANAGPTKHPRSEATAGDVSEEGCAAKRPKHILPAGAAPKKLTTNV